MADIDADGTRAIGEQRLGGVAERAAGIDDVVDDDAVAAGDFADDVHDLGNAGALAAFVDDGEVAVEAAGDAAGAEHAADIGADDHQLAAGETLLDIAREQRSGEQVVHGNV